MSADDLKARLSKLVVGSKIAHERLIDVERKLNAAKKQLKAASDSRCKAKKEAQLFLAQIRETTKQLAQLEKRTEHFEGRPPRMRSRLYSFEVVSGSVQALQDNAEMKYGA